MIKKILVVWGTIKVLTIILLPLSFCVNVICLALVFRKIEKRIKSLRKLLSAEKLVRQKLETILLEHINFSSQEEPMPDWNIDAHLSEEEVNN